MNDGATMQLPYQDESQEILQHPRRYRAGRRCDSCAHLLTETPPCTRCNKIQDDEYVFTIVITYLANSYPKRSKTQLVSIFQSTKIDIIISADSV